MDLVPELRNADGKFEIPDPRTDVDGFMQAHQALTRVVNTTLVQAALATDPYQIANNPHEPMTFQPAWRSAEVGAGTNGEDVSFPDGTYASYGGKSFLTGIEPVPGTSSTMYQITRENGDVRALVNAQGTNVPCVNRLLLAEANTGGTWSPPTYALGPEGGDAFLVIDLCVDITQVVTTDPQRLLGPNGALFVALQWADTDDLAHMRSDDETGLHGGAD
jgi:hypothetical protein